jgi:large subunit ribosomal protein L9
MDIILLERVAKLGQIGDTVTVKNGYARNFLLPQKKALRATRANMAVFEAQKHVIEANNTQAKSDAEAVAAKMTDVSVVLIRQAGESGQLFGSVSSRDISVALTEAGFKTDKNQVILNRSLKTLGLYDILVRLHPEVEITVVINIARSAEESEIQAAGGDVDAEAADEEFAVEDFFENEDDAEAVNADDAEETEEEAPAEEEAAAETEEEKSE